MTLTSKNKKSNLEYDISIYTQQIKERQDLINKLKIQLKTLEEEK